EADRLPRARGEADGGLRQQLADPAPRAVEDLDAQRRLHEPEVHDLKADGALRLHREEALPLRQEELRAGGRLERRPDRLRSPRPLESEAQLRIAELDFVAHSAGCRLTVTRALRQISPDAATRYPGAPIFKTRFGVEGESTNSSTS